MKAFNPKVSILIPLYNSEKYIDNTIQSCLKQIYKNIEVVIVDDGSTDNSYQIAKKYATDNVIVVRQENAGACKARNRAFELSTGVYIQYLDADDLLSNSKIEEQIRIFEKFGDKIVVSSKWDRFYYDIIEAKFPDRPTYRDYDNALDWLIDVVEKKDMGQTSVWLTHRDIIQKSGLWNEDLTINQDGEFFTRVLLNSEGVKFCKNANVYYRSGDKTRISYTTKKRDVSLLKSYLSIEENILKKENSERTRHACYLLYLRFIYENYDLADKDIINMAKKRMTKIGFSELKPYGGKFFKQIAKIIGFENTLKLRKLLKRK